MQPPSYYIRQAESGDAANIQALTYAAYAKWVAVIGREPLPMRVDYNHAVIKHDFDLLYAGDVLQGLIETFPINAALWIENLAINPTAQGQGYGKILLRRAEQCARAQGYSLIRLCTNAKFEGNVSFYAHHGYQVEREEHSSLGHVIYMCKSVNPQPVGAGAYT